jgi:DNA-binding winged helix-turn-helix (wHTH) protein
MGEAKRSGAPVRFGAFEADLDSRQLRKHGLKIRVPDQPFLLLSELLERPGEIVTREELQNKLWPSDTFVDFDRGLNKAMNRLRDALGDSAEEPRYIETVPKRGYRFIGEIQRIPEMPDLQILPDEAVPAPRPEPATRWKPRVAIGVAIGVALAAIIPAISLLHLSRVPPRPSHLFRSSLLPPAQSAFLPRNFALSADWSRLAFVAIGGDGRPALWIRTLSASTAHRLDETEGATYPFWSPDGRHIGFFAERKLKTLDVATGAVKILDEAVNPSGGAWNGDGVIIYSAGIGQPLYRISATGGQRVPATDVDQGQTAQTSSWPCFLPDGRHFLYFLQWNVRGESRNAGLYAGSLDPRRDKLISTEITGNIAFALGQLLFVREGKLLAQPFDPVRLEIKGPPTPLTEQEIETDAIYSHSGFAVSEPGDLVFESAPDFSSHLTWFDSSGKELGQIPQTGYRSPTLSPDGRKVAVSCEEAFNGKHSICVHDLERGVSSRITKGTDDGIPIWSRDGKEITYTSREQEIAYLERVPADGLRAPQVLFEGGRMFARGWLPDGRMLYSKVEGGESRMYLLAGRELRFLWEGSEGQLSLDSKWIAQASAPGIFVQTVAEPRVHVQIANAGAQPRWSRDGRQLFYIAADRKMMAVSFDSKNGRAGPPRVLFSTRIVGTRIVGFQYDVAPDGRFLINSLPSGTSPLTLVTGWTGRLGF